MNLRKFSRFVAVSAYIVALIWLTSMTVGFAARQGYLIAVAVPLRQYPCLGLSVLTRSEQRAGWTLFTIWLGSTYAATGTAPELFVFGAIAALGIAAFRFSPLLFPVAWFGHIVWDLMPRQLPEVLADLPTACMIFDGIIGAWLAWRAWSGWWSDTAPDTLEGN